MMVLIWVLILIAFNVDNQGLSLFFFQKHNRVLRVLQNKRFITLTAKLDHKISTFITATTHQACCSPPFPGAVGKYFRLEIMIVDFISPGTNEYAIQWLVGIVIDHNAIGFCVAFAGG